VQFAGEIIFDSFAYAWEKLPERHFANKFYEKCGLGLLKITRVPKTGGAWSVKAGYLIK